MNDGRIDAMISLVTARPASDCTRVADIVPAVTLADALLSLAKGTDAKRTPDLLSWRAALGATVDMLRESSRGMQEMLSL